MLLKIFEGVTYALPKLFQIMIELGYSCITCSQNSDNSKIFPEWSVHRELHLSNWEFLMSKIEAFAFQLSVLKFLVCIFTKFFAV
ncbi:MAG: hypothetical protein CM15mP100_0360 [Alphaproteobacteria bacterium]|nr:MAG: hypothetical protein CM15mP100_0360 [Alphaproteobacteria bacterium]